MMRGFIFFSVLLFLQIFTSLGLYGMVAVKARVVMSDHLLQQYNNKMYAKLALLKIENYLLTHESRCMIPITSPAILAEKRNEWWKEHGCHGNVAKNKYDYVVESLAKDACTFVSDSSNHYLGTAMYYRITLLFSPFRFKEVKIILQSIIVKENNEITSCSGIWHRISSGCQMRRELVGRKRIEGYYPID